MDGAKSFLNNGQAKLAPNGIGLRRWAEPDRGEAQCGWSGAMQRRGTPSPPQVYRIYST